MKKIKVIRIIARLNIGGPAIHTILLTAGLDKERFDSLLVAGSVGPNEADMSYYAAERNVLPIFIPELKREINLFSDLAALIKIFKLIKREQPDIIHTHTAKAGTLGRVAGILYNLTVPAGKRCRLVHTFHGHVFNGYFGKLKSAFFIFIERLLAKSSSKIITVSSAVKKELLALKIAKVEKIEVIPLGLELKEFLNMPEAKGTGLNIGIIGRLVPVKNHRLFLEAIKETVRTRPDMKLKAFIIGDGEVRGELENYARKLGITEFVSFLGWQRDLVKAYSGIDIVALTSLNEGTPVSLIEAMAAGRPIVATDAGGVGDLLGGRMKEAGSDKQDFLVLERGILVKKDGAVSFSMGLSILLENPCLRKRIILNARDYAASFFVKERLVGDIEGLYFKLMSG